MHANYGIHIIKKDILSIENIQRMFTRHIKEVAHLAPRLYLLQRMRERYLIIYVWKILEGQVMNLSNPVMSLRFNSYRLKSFRFFNSLPSGIRNISSSNPSQTIPWQQLEKTVWIIFLVQRVAVT